VEAAARTEGVAATQKGQSHRALRMFHRRAVGFSYTGANQENTRSPKTAKIRLIPKLARFLQSLLRGKETAHRLVPFP
ncbi:MAG: hypothetical protein QF582_18815, partial [Alphaproteobacteria bacterium]|nr:hypothetical protein [Alphaproteobacteria bacterium]